MREIKYRAWNVRRFLKEDEFAILGNGKLVFLVKDGESDAEYREMDFLDVELMQYTGLTDRNGKEIYEGDILHVLEVSNTSDLEYKSPVEFIDSGFLVTQPDECQVPLAVFHNLDTSYPLFEIEVIGNIYENPELLDVSA